MDWNFLGRFGIQAIGAIFGALVMAWLFLPQQTTLGHRELHYSGRLKMVAVLMTAFALACAYGGTLTSGSNALWAYGLAAVFGAGGVYLLLETFTRQVRFDETNLYDQSIWRRAERTLPWVTLTRYDYSELNQWHIFTADGHGTFRVSALLSGHDEFATFLERKLIEVGLSLPLKDLTE